MKGDAVQRWATQMLLIALIALAGCAQAPRRGSTPIPAKASGEGPALRASFATASDRLSPRAREAIVANARWLRQHPGEVLVLTGHADERGSDAFNLELGDRRSRACAAAMLHEGAAASQMIILSQGEREPLDPRHIPAAWGRNRRVEFSTR